MPRLISAVAAAVIAVTVLASPMARAEELQFAITFGDRDPGAFETFDIDALEPGTVSAASFFGDIDFEITNDSLGNTVLQLGAFEDDGRLAAGLDDNDVSYTTPSVVTLGQQLYAGTPPLLSAYAGETLQGLEGDTISITAVSAAPEPLSWAMILTGLFVIGSSLRLSRFRGVGQS